MPKRATRPKRAKIRRRIASTRNLKTYTYTVNIEPAVEGGFVVQVPLLPGCYSQGESLQEAIANAQEAIESYLESLSKHGERIPIASFV